MLLRLVRILVSGLLLVVACAAFRIAQPTPSTSPISAGRQQPWSIAPRYDLPQVATDEQLRPILDRLLPAAGLTDTNHLIHALRLWGPDANFADPRYLSGREMLAFCLDDTRFRSLAGEETPPLVQVTSAGAQVRRYQPGDQFARTGAVHPNDLLATLAESGVELDTPLAARDRTTTVRMLLETALRGYHPDQFEYEWTAISYARYAFPIDRWTNDYGQTIRLETLVDQLIADDAWRGVCGGTHRLEALVVLLRADQQVRVLSPGLKSRVLSHLAEISRQLVRSQDPSGFWNKQWHLAGTAASHDPGSRAEQILATGHHLEWLALAPPEVLPPRENLVRAGQWLVHALQEVDQATLDVEYGPFSHAARALCLWRGRTPWQVWQSEQVVSSHKS